MSNKVMLNLILAFLMVSSSLVLVSASDGGSGGSAARTDPDEATGIVQAPAEKVWDISELEAMGAASVRKVYAKDMNELTQKLRNDRFWERQRTFGGPMPEASGKDQNDDITNATLVHDGDSITGNVTSWIGGSPVALHPSDVDFYMANLSINGPARKVDRLIIDIYSTDAENKHATLATDFFYPDNLLGQWNTLDFEATGAHHGSHSRFVYYPKGEPTSSYTLSIAFRFMVWNTTKVDYKFDVDITTVTRPNSEWNGEIAGAEYVNRTIKPTPLQMVNISHEYYDWFDLSDVIADEGLQTAREDHVKVSLKIDAATEERKQMFGYAGPTLYGKTVNTTAIMFIFFIWQNYTDSSFSIATVGGNIPYAGILFGNDPVNVGFNAQVDHAWLGVSPLQLWLTNNQAFAGAEGNAEYKYNITNINAVILPPNDPPRKIGDIPDFMYDEDTGPWEDIVDLEQYFSDDWSDNDLRFEVKPVGTPPKEISVEIAPDGRHLRINVTVDNWFTAAPLSYQIIAYDWGVDWKKNSGDDAKVLSNVFKVTINPVNDNAYIEKVDTLAGTVVNDHQWIVFQITQTQAVRTRKIFGMDNDTADRNNLIYASNSTTPAFRMNDKGQFDFIPTNDQVGTTWIKVTLDDGNAPEEDDYCLLKFVVTNINDGPVLQTIKNRDTGDTFDLTKTDLATFYNVQEDLEINLTVQAYDPDIAIFQPDQLTWSVGSVGWNVYPDELDPFVAYITYTPTNDDAINGEARCKFFVRDSQQIQSSEAEIVLYVNNVNDAPTILSINGEPVENGAVTLDAANKKGPREDELFTLTVLAEDIDDKDAVTFNINDPTFVQTPLPDNDFGTTFQMLPTQDMVGIPLQVIVTVLDRKEKRASVRVNYVVNGTNDPPDEPKIEMTALSGLKVDQVIRFRARDYGDIDGDELVLEWNFGDGSAFAYGEEVEHVYKWANPFMVTLIARDPSGAEAVVKKSIVIAPKDVIVDPNLDSDSDGMPDWWEDLYAGFNKNDPSDANKDFDKDGFTNLDEYKYKDVGSNSTNPLDKNSHPPVVEGTGSDNMLLFVIIIAAVVVMLVIIVLFVFLLRGPKQVQQPMMYGREASPQLPPQPVRQQPLQPNLQPQLPPKPPEEDLMEGFLEEASKEVQDSMDIGQDDNVWRPPAPAEEEGHSHIEDLLDEPVRDDKAAGTVIAPPPTPPK